MPSVLALAKECAPKGRTGLVITFTMAGVPIGGIIAALIGLAVIPAHGWRPMFAIGAAVSVLIFVLTLFLLPESAAFRQAQHTATDAATAAKPVYATFSSRGGQCCRCCSPPPPS